MSIELYLAYLVVCIVATVMPGPTNMLIVANGMRYGVRAGLLNVAGTEVALALMIAALAAGLTSIIEVAGQWFEWLKLAGAAYLIWIGWKMLRSGAQENVEARPPRRGFFLQGFLVSLGNPKQLLFFGALLPQFLDPAAAYLPQIMIMGVSAILVSIVSDGAYAVLAGKAGGHLSAVRQRLVSTVGGTCLIGGGVWLAMSRAR